MAIYLTARFQVKPDALARYEQAIRELVDAVKDEPHT
jgi:quinol monooxygenase YgiN